MISPTLDHATIVIFHCEIWCIRFFHSAHKEDVCLPFGHSVNVSSNTMVKGSSFILDFLCISWHSQYQSFSFYQESVVYAGILFEHFLQKFFHDLGFPLYPFIFPAFLFRCLFILQCLIFRSCPIMYFLEILRKIEEHIVEIIFQFFAPVQIIKPVLSAILQTFFSDIRSFFTLHIGISPTLSALSHAIISTFAFNISADLMDGRFPVLLPDQRCVASEKFIEPFQFFRFQVVTRALRFLQ